MATAGRPQTAPLEEGELFDTKQMVGEAGISMPRHKASIESALIVTEGRCIVKFDDTNREMDAGDSLIIPADAWHEIVADPDFLAVHIMPKDIRFTFSR